MGPYAKRIIASGLATPRITTWPAREPGSVMSGWNDWEEFIPRHGWQGGWITRMALLRGRGQAVGLRRANLMLCEDLDAQAGP